jgi:hypothetical protein
MIMSSLQVALFQRAIRYVRISSSSEITREISVIGIQGAVKERSNELHLGVQVALRKVHQPFLTSGQAESLSERNASSPGITARSL